MTFSRIAKKKSRIEIIPMIDVIFFLLVFFILFTTFKTRPSGLDINLPEAATVTNREEASLTVSVTETGSMYLDDIIMTEDELRAYLSSRLLENPDTSVIIKADRDVKYERVIDAMDIIRASGGHRLFLAVERK